MNGKMFFELKRYKLSRVGWATRYDCVKGLGFQEFCSLAVGIFIPTFSCIWYEEIPTNEANDLFRKRGVFIGKACVRNGFSPNDFFIQCKGLSCRSVQNTHGVRNIFQMRVIAYRIRGFVRIYCNDCALNTLLIQVLNELQPTLHSCAT